MPVKERAKVNKIKRIACGGSGKCAESGVCGVLRGRAVAEAGH